MRHVGLFVALLAASAALAADEASLLGDLRARYPAFGWSDARIVRGDLNRDGTPDTVALGVSAGKVAIVLLLSGKDPKLTEVPVDNRKQFGICPGAGPNIAFRPQSEAPLNALGQTPPGYQICAKCIEIVVTGGDCDPLQFYWDTKSNKLAWWRA